MYPRKQLDISPGELLVALAATTAEVDVDDLEGRVERLWSATSLVAYSVRSAFDAFLTAARFPAGGKVLMSAVTIPHMPELVELHQLIPVALDLDLPTMTVLPQTLERALREHDNVCAVVIVDLFGARHPLSELAPICRRRGALLVEDAAQAYDGASWRGSPDADVTLVSFGPIKTASAVGGAMVTVHDRRLRERMAAEMAGWSRETPTARAKRVLRWMGLRAMCNPELFGVFVGAFAARGVDYDDWLRNNVRGFAGTDLLAQIRRRPSAGLLRTLERRLDRGAATEVRNRAEAGARVARQLAPEVLHLGGSGVRHTHWLFPIASRDPSRLVEVLRRAGFDATDGASTLVALPGAVAAEEAMKRVVYVPVYDRMSTVELDRLAALINDVELSTAEGQIGTGTLSDLRRSPSPALSKSAQRQFSHRFVCRRPSGVLAR